MNTDLPSLATPAHAFLESLFRSAVAAAHPENCLPPQPAGAARARAARDPRRRQGGRVHGREITEQHYLERERLAAFAHCRGLAVTRHGYARPTVRPSELIEAGHPVPDLVRQGSVATERTLLLAEAARAEDLVVVLVWGGASANCIAPEPGYFAGRETSKDPGLASLRRIDWGNQHRSQASLAHQGGSPSRAGLSGSGPDPCDFRCARG